MRIILDGCVHENVSPKSALAIIDEFLKRQVKENRVIRGCRLNGMEVEGDFVQAIKDNLDNIATLELSSQAIAELLAETALTAQEYIEQLIFNIESIAGEIALGKRVNSELWVALLEGLEWLVEVCRGLLSQKETSAPTAKAMLEQVAQLGNLMTDVQQTYEGQDYITAADILEYELVGVLKNMQETLREFGPSREV